MLPSKLYLLETALLSFIRLYYAMILFFKKRFFGGREGMPSVSKMPTAPEEAPAPDVVCFNGAICCVPSTDQALQLLTIMGARKLQGAAWDRFWIGRGNGWCSLVFASFWIRF